METTNKNKKPMKNDFILNLENRLRGIGTRLKELHFSAPSITIHKLIDDYSSDFAEFEDEIMENSQALWGTIKPGELDPVLPEATDFITLLEEVRGILAGIKKEAGEDMMWTGIINIVDEFWSTTNKYIYLQNIENKVG